MKKIRIILFMLLLTLSTNSVTYAYEIFPVATNDLDLSVSPSSLDEKVSILDSSAELEVYFEDAYNLWMAMKFQSKPKTYTVVEGDNLYRIALNNDISLESLMRWNGLTGDLIHPDDVLILSGDDTDVKSVNSEQEVIVAESSPIVAGAGEMLVTATAYTAYCNGCSGTTAYGIDLRSNPDQKVIAVDPRIIPLGTKVWVEGYGEAIAGDTGGAIKGKKIDVFIPSYNSAMEWGVKKVKIRVIN